MLGLLLSMESLALSLGCDRTTQLELAVAQSHPQDPSKTALLCAAQTQAPLPRGPSGGYYSTDDTTWNLVGTVTVPTAAATQDVGLAVTSHGPETTGEVDFDGFTTSK
jgi:hypothetical protein